MVGAQQGISPSVKTKEGGEAVLINEQALSELLDFLFSMTRIPEERVSELSENLIPIYKEAVRLEEALEVMKGSNPSLNPTLLDIQELFDELEIFVDEVVASKDVPEHWVLMKHQAHEWQTGLRLLKAGKVNANFFD